MNLATLVLLSFRCVALFYFRVVTQQPTFYRDKNDTIFLKVTHHSLIVIQCGLVNVCRRGLVEGHTIILFVIRLRQAQPHIIL
ncbi:MAG: hypothetical protein JWQ40_1444 [Segetibacter sp.]|nr:hypothetical protein [Segetibacter sp.]